MSSEQRFEFTKDNIDTYLKELAREYRKLVGKNMRAELILIGGASVLVNYGFRDMTTDIDALIQAASSMKDAINRVGDRYDLPNGWLNADFMKTGSYTPKLIEFSEYYRTYSNVLEIRTVSAEYLIAMKLRSGRQYKSDLSDVLGILAEHEKRGNPITMEQVRQAAVNLYGAWDAIPVVSREYIRVVMENGRFQELYRKAVGDELATKADLIRFEQEHPGVLKEDNVDAVIESLQKKSDRTSVLKLLHERQAGSARPTQERKAHRKTDHER